MFDTLTLFKRRDVLTPLDEELKRRSQGFLVELEQSEAVKTQAIKKYKVDPVKELEALGFSNALNVSEVRKLNKTVQTVLQSIQFIKQVKGYFGEDTLVIKEEDMMYLIDKYDLVCGPFEEYIGHIPPEKISGITQAKNKIDFFRNLRNYSSTYEFTELYNHYYNNRLIYLKSIYYNDEFTAEVKKRLLRFGMFLVPDRDDYVYSSLGGIRSGGRNYIENILGFREGSTTMSDVDLTDKRQHLFICAPSHDMAVDFSSKTMKYPDPLICSLGINNSVVIHTMWGPESEDSVLDKYKS